MAQFIYNPLLVLKTSTHIDYTRRYTHRPLPMPNSQIDSSDRLPNPDYKDFTKTTQYIDLITQVSGAVRRIRNFKNEGELFHLALRKDNSRFL